MTNTVSENNSFLINLRSEKSLKEKYYQLFNKESEFKNRFIYSALKNFDLFCTFVESLDKRYIEDNEIESIQIDFINFVFLQNPIESNDETFFEDYLVKQNFQKIFKSFKGHSFYYVYKENDKKITVTVDNNFYTIYYLYPIAFLKSVIAESAEYKNISSFDEFCHIINTLKALTYNIIK